MPRMCSDAGWRSRGASYDAVASLYDRHWGNEFSAAAKAAFDAHLLPRLSRGASVLDLCCGTGLILAHLEQLGFAACGVDESAKMLAIARPNAPRARLLHDDMATFDAGSQFDAAVSFYNSLNHARSVQHLRGTLVNVANHLTPGGFFLFDYVSPEGFETAWEWREKIDGESQEVRYAYDKSSGHAICVVDQRHEIRQIAIPVGEMGDALRAAGLTMLLDAPMTGASPAGRQLVLARKQ